MADPTLIPVDHDPFAQAASPTLVPVDHDPFEAAPAPKKPERSITDQATRGDLRQPWERDLNAPPRTEPTFAERIGDEGGELGKAAPLYMPIKAATEGLQTVTRPLNRVGEATVEGAKTGWGSGLKTSTGEAAYSPAEAQKLSEMVGEGPAKALMTLGLPIDLAMRGYNALMQGGFGAFKQTLKEVGISEEGAQSAVDVLSDPGLAATFMMPGAGGLHEAAGAGAARKLDLEAADKAARDALAPRPGATTPAAPSKPGPPEPPGVPAQAIEPPPPPPPAPPGAVTAADVLERARTGKGYQPSAEEAAQMAADVNQATAEGRGPNRLEIDDAAKRAALNPTPAQKEAGNYPKGHTSVDGIPIAIETAQGEERTGVGPDGKPYATEMPDHYGYIKGTKGADGDPVDAFIGPNPETKVAYVIDQRNPDSGNFDEHKVMLGYPSREAAVADYVGSFSDGRGADRVQRVTAVSTDDLKTWLKDGDTSRPFAPQAAEIPSSLARAGESGEAKNVSENLAPPTTQARLEGDHVSSLMPPSESSITRPTVPPSSSSGPRITRPDVPVDPSTGRKVWHQLEDSKELHELAQQSLHLVHQVVDGLVEGVPGAERYTGGQEIKKLKGPTGIEGKLAANQPANTIPDYIRSRIVFDSARAMAQVLDRLKRSGQLLDLDDFSKGRGKSGYRGVHAQVDLGNGMSAELQLVPRPINEAMSEAHAIRQPYKRVNPKYAPPEIKEAYERAIAAAQKKFDTAWYSSGDAWTAHHVPMTARVLKPSEAITSTGTRIPVDYALVEAHDLVPSHLDDLSENPAYPPAMQPRDRSRSATGMQIQEMLNPERFRPELLGETPDAGTGAPIIGPDGTIESGNMRSMALRRAYGQGMPAAGAYRKFLESQGYNTAGMSEPVLVRINRAKLDDEGRNAFAREANKPAQLQMSATERAIADAKSLPDHVMELVKEGDLLSAKNRGLVTQVLANIATSAERGSLMDRNGALSQEGLRRVQGALLAKAYGEPSVIESLLESTDQNYKAIGNALIENSGRWADLRRAAAAGDIPKDLDITPNLMEAVAIIDRVRREGRNVVEYVKQLDMLAGRAVPADTEGVLGWMLGGKDFTKRIGQQKVADAIRYYAEEADKVKPGPNLFGEAQRTTAPAIIETARVKAQGKEAPPEPGLFTKPAARRGETKPTAGTGEEVGIIPGFHGVPLRPTAELFDHEQELVDKVNGIIKRMVPTADVKGWARIRELGANGGDLQGLHYRRGFHSVINWALEGSKDPELTVRHEAIHALHSAGLFTDGEWKTLEDAAKGEGWIKKHQIDIAYDHLDENGQLEEAIAEEFGHREKMGMSGVPAALKPIFYKVGLFLRRVRDAVRSALGRKVTADDVFTRVESGEVGERGIEPQADAIFGGPEEVAAQRGAKGERELSPEYQRALDKMKVIERQFADVTRDYRDRRIGDEEYLKARRERDAASKEFDAAYAKEQARKAPAVEKTDQGDQMVLPGGERSARQAQAGRDQAGRGMLRSDRRQAGIDETPLFGGKGNTGDLFDVKAQRRPAPGFVRMYHGEAPEAVGKRGSPRWFTSDPRYAQSYADKSRRGVVSYVDLPENHPLIAPDYPEQGISNGFHRNVELPADLADQRQPLANDVKTQRQGPGAQAIAPPLPLNMQQRARAGIIARSAIGKIFSPSTVSKMAEGQAALTREEIGRARRDAQIARASLEHIRDVAPPMMTKEGDNLMAYIEGRSHGATLADPKLQPVADQIRSLNKAVEHQLRAMPELQRMSFMDDYYRHMWEDPQGKKVSGFISNWVSKGTQGSGSFRKQRVFPTYADGIAAGLRPLHPNIIDGEMAALTNSYRFIAHNRIFGRMRDAGTAKYFVPGQQPEGWVELKGRLAAVTVPIDEHAAMPMRAFAPEDVARVYNNGISRGIYDTAAGPLYDKLMRAKNGMTGLELSLSPFHAVVESGEAMVSEIARGLADVVNGRPIRGVRKIVTSPAAPVANVLAGRRGAQEYLRPGSTDAQTQHLVKLLTEANMSPIGRGAAQYLTSERGAYRVTLQHPLKDFTNALRSSVGRITTDWQQSKMRGAIAPIREFTSNVGRAMDTVMAPLFDYAIPRLKYGAAMGRLADWLDHNPTATLEEQRAKARELSDTMDDRMGELNYDNMFQHAIQKQAAWFGMRAYGWALGTQRLLVGGTADLLRGRITERVAYLAALGIFTSFVNGALTYLNTGRVPSGMDFLAFDTGNTDDRGHPIRATLPGYAREYAGLAFNAYAQGPLKAMGSYGYGKVASMWQSMLELGQNRDWRDDPIGPPGTTPTGEKSEKLPEFVDRYMTEILKHYTPINWRGFMGIERSDQTEGLTDLERVLSMRKAPFAMQDPEAARTFFQKLEDKPKGAEEKWKSKLRREGPDSYVHVFSNRSAP